MKLGRWLKDHVQWAFGSGYFISMPSAFMAGRMEELTDWLRTYAPKRWDYTGPRDKNTNVLGWREQDRYAIRFLHESDLVLFKLAWSEEIAASKPKKVILPVIRNVMPGDVLNEILTAQDMTGKRK